MNTNRIWLLTRNTPVGPDDEREVEAIAAFTTHERALKGLKRRMDQKHDHPDAWLAVVPVELRGPCPHCGVEHAYEQIPVVDGRPDGAKSTAS